MAADGSVIIEILGDAKEFASSIKNVAGTAVKGLAVSVAAVGTAVTAMGGAAIKAGVEFESAFAGVKKTVDASEEELAALREGILGLSEEMPQSAAAIAGVAEAAGQLGIETDSILEFTRTMVQLGDATNLSAEEAATTLARFANITGMAQSDFDRLGSTIVALGNNMATTEAEIAAMGSRIAGAGAQVGLSEDEILAFAASLSSLGIEAEAGGTAFSTLISKISLAASTGSEQLGQFAEVAGMSADEFSQAFAQDASGAIMAFIQGLSRLDASGESAIAVLDAMELSDIRMRDALLRAAGGVEIFNEALSIGSDAWKENSALANEAAQRYATVESQFEILKNQATNLGIAVYDGLREPLVEIMGVTGAFIEQLSGAFDAGGLTGLVSEIGTVAAEAATGIAAQAPAMVNAAVSLIQSFIDGISQNSGQFSAAAIALITSLVSGIAALLPELLQLGIDLTIELAEGLISGIPDLVAQLPQIIEGTVNFLLDNLQPLLDVGVDLLMALADGIIKALPDLVARLPEIISSFIQFIAKNLPQIAAAGTELLMKLVEGILKALPEIIALPAKLVIPLVEGIIAYVQSFREAGQDFVRGLVEGIQNMAAWVGDKIRSFCEGILNDLKDFFGIHSPSQVMRDEVGVMLALGLANGIDDGAHEAETAAISLSESVKETLVQMAQEVEAVQEESAKKILQAQIYTLETLQSEYEDALEDVQRSRDRLSDSLSDTRELFTQTDTGLELTDLQASIDQINAYGDAIEALKDRGVSSGLLDEILAMDTDNATAYANKLLDMAETEYDAYISLWEEKEAAAEQVASEIYSEEFSALKEEYINKLPEEMRPAGEEAMDSLNEGLRAGGEVVISTAAEIADSVIAQVQRISAALQEAVQMEAMRVSSSLSVNSSAQEEARSAARDTQTAQTAWAISRVTSESSKDIVLQVNGQEFARATIPDYRAVEDSIPRIEDD